MLDWRYGLVMGYRFLFCWKYVFILVLNSKMTGRIPYLLGSRPRFISPKDSSQFQGSMMAHLFVSCWHLANKINCEIRRYAIRFSSRLHVSLINNLIYNFSEIHQRNKTRQFYITLIEICSPLLCLCSSTVYSRSQQYPVFPQTNDCRWENATVLAIYWQVQRIYVGSYSRSWFHCWLRCGKQNTSV